MPRQKEGKVTSSCTFGKSISDLMGEPASAVYHVADFDGFIAVSGPVKGEESVDFHVCRLVMGTLSDDELYQVISEAEALLEMESA